MNQVSDMSKHKGAVLIVCLILLTVMTLLVLNAMMRSTVQEKMAGNKRNKELSFQAAESALRAGENEANGLLSNAFSDAGTDGFYTRSIPGDTSPKPVYPVWDQTGVNWQNVTGGAADNLVAAPQYIIEDYGTEYRDTDCALIVPLPPGCAVPVYRITARGWGLNTNTFSMVQSTYKQQ